MRINPVTDALIIVDLQHDFLPGGALAVAGGDEILEPIARLARRFATVVATQDFHPSEHVSFAVWPVHCVAGSHGAQLHPKVADDAVTLVLRKGTRREIDSYSAFEENPGPDGRRASTGLAAWLKARGIERVFVVGLALDYCVAATTVDASHAGFQTWLVRDLTRAVAGGAADWLPPEIASSAASVCHSADLEAS